MVCKNCKASIPDDSMFCPSCGQKVEAEPVVTPAPTFGSAFRQAGSLDGSDSGMGDPVVKRKPTVSQEDTGLRFSSSFKCADIVLTERADTISASPKCKEVDRSGGYVVEEKEVAQSIPHRGSSLNQNAAYCNDSGGDQKEYPSEKKRLGWLNSKTAKKVVITAGALVAVLVLVLIVGSATNWFGFYGPAAQIASATQKTLLADNFTVDFLYVAGGDKIKGTAYIAIDPDERDLTVYVKAKNGSDSAVFVIYKEYSITTIDGETYGYDIGNRLDALFDLYEDGTAKDFSWEDFIDDVYGDGAYDRLSEHIDFDALDMCISEYYKKLNDEKWLKEYAGYSVEKVNGVTLHCLEPDWYDFFKESASYAEDAFVNEDEYDDLIEELGDMKTASQYVDTEIVFGIKSGKLVEFKVEVSDSGNGSANSGELQLEFYDIGKTKFDTKELDDMLAEAKKNGYYR